MVISEISVDGKVVKSKKWAPDTPSAKIASWCLRSFRYQLIVANQNQIVHASFSDNNFITGMNGVVRVNRINGDVK